MEIQEFERHRKSVTTRVGQLSYVDVGSGPVALFLHGVTFNSHIWRRAIGALAGERRLIAVDLPAHGQSVSSPHQDLSLTAHAELLDAFLEQLGVDEVDLVGNDTGGALCQVFAVRYPDRVRTLVLTNCDADDNLPPAEFSDGKKLAEAGQLGALLGQMGQNPALARTAERGYNLAFEKPDAVSDEDVRVFSGPFAEPARARELDRFALSIRVDDLLAIKPGLADITAPTLIV